MKRRLAVTLGFVICLPLVGAESGYIYVGSIANSLPEYEPDGITGILHEVGPILGGRTLTLTYSAGVGPASVYVKFYGDTGVYLGWGTPQPGQTHACNKPRAAQSCIAPLGATSFGVVAVEGGQIEYEARHVA